jgi:hypothetical protein
LNPRFKHALFLLLPVFTFLLLSEILVRLLRIDAIQDETYFFGFNGCPPYFLKTTTTDNHTVYRTNPEKDIEETSFPRAKDVNEFRIFTLGGSAAYGEPFGPEGSFSHWLSLRLNAIDPNRLYRVVNCARRGFGSVRVKRIFNEIIEYDPDLVIVYFGNNEQRDYLFHRIEINIEIRPWLRTIKRVLDHSFIFRMAFHTLFKKKITSFGAQNIDNTLSLSAFDENVFSSNVQFLMERTEILDSEHGGSWVSRLDSTDLSSMENLEEVFQVLNWTDRWPDKFRHIFTCTVEGMISQSRRKNVPIMFLTRSRNFYYNRDARLLFQRYDDANRIIKRVCESEQIPVLETLPLLMEHFQSEIGFNAFMDIVHPTLLTNQILARGIVQKMMDTQMTTIPDTQKFEMRWHEHSIAEESLLHQFLYPSQYYALSGWQKLICLNMYEDKEKTTQDILSLAEKALSLDPYDDKAYFLLGTLYTLSNDMANVRRIWADMKSHFSFVR